MPPEKQTEGNEERRPLPVAEYEVFFTANLTALELIAFGQFVGMCKDKMTCLKVRVKLSKLKTESEKQEVTSD